MTSEGEQRTGDLFTLGLPVKKTSHLKAFAGKLEDPKPFQMHRRPREDGVFLLLLR